MAPLLVDGEVWDRIERLEVPFNRHGFDPYGVAKKDLGRWFTALAWLYRNYFHVRVHGLEHVPPRGRAMLVGNHSGGVALDGGMIVACCFLELEPPRLAQAMADKFISRLPFASEWAARCGHFTGLPEHAHRLLEDDRLLMVFPEGARGTAKLYPERHSLVAFGPGFVRLAQRTRSPVVPMAFLGGGDAIPTVANSELLGRLVGAPYVPITPYIVPLPRPVELDIYFSEPIEIPGDGREDDEIIESHVQSVKYRIASLIEQGRGERKSRSPWRGDA